VLVGNGPQRSVLKQIFATLRKKRPSFCLHTKLSHEGNTFTLLLKWIDFNLVYGGLDLVERAISISRSG
jgi:hypothetical protein